MFLKIVVLNGDDKIQTKETIQRVTCLAIMKKYKCCCQTDSLVFSWFLLKDRGTITLWVNNKPNNTKVTQSTNAIFPNYIWSPRLQIIILYILLSVVFTLNTNIKYLFLYFNSRSKT